MRARTRHGSSEPLREAIRALAHKVIIDPGKATPRPYGVALFNSNLISTLSDIAPQDVELTQLQLADPGEVLPGWHVPQGRLPKLRLPVFRSLAQAVTRTLRPAGDFLLLRGAPALYHSLVLDEGLDVDPSRRIVSVYSLDFLDSAGREADRAIGLAEYVRASRAVVTTTEHLATRLADELSIDRERVSVIPGGVDHTRFFPRDEREVEEVLARYSIQRPYALAVADSGSGKTLVEFEAVAEKLWRKGKVELVIVGTSRGRRPGARRLGYVPREHLPALYTGAVAMVTLHPHQGFALAAVESLACGTPVVAARSPGIEETLQGRARLVEDGDVAEAAEAVLEFSDRRHRRKASAEGIEWARRFTWYKSATAVLELYRKIFSSEQAGPVRPGAVEASGDTQRAFVEFEATVSSDLQGSADSGTESGSPDGSSSKSDSAADTPETPA